MILDSGIKARLRLDASRHSGASSDAQTNAKEHCHLFHCGDSRVFANLGVIRYRALR